MNSVNENARGVRFRLTAFRTSTIKQIYSLLIKDIKPDGDFSTVTIVDKNASFHLVTCLTAEDADKLKNTFTKLVVSDQAVVRSYRQIAPCYPPLIPLHFHSIEERKKINESLPLELIDDIEDDENSQDRITTKARTSTLPISPVANRQLQAATSPNRTNRTR